MPIFERGDIVAVPYPYVERPVVVNRPALVVATGLGPDETLLWVMMITSARNASWPGDITVTVGQQESGLRATSVVRTAKISTVEARAAKVIGKLFGADLEKVNEALASALGL